MKYSLRCPICNEYYESNHHVILDEFNTVIHQKCYYQGAQNGAIKDSGPLKHIIEKYPFFHSLLKN